MNTIQISDKQWENNHCLLVAATEGNVEHVRLWLDVADPTADDYLPLFRAISYGHTECLKALIPVSDIANNLEKALAAAVRVQRPECLELLLEYKTPTTDVHEALVVSANKNSCACLELLLPHSNTKNNTSALYTAIYNRSIQAAELLLPVSDPQTDKRILQVAKNLPMPLFQQLIDCIPHPDYAAINDVFLRCVNSGDTKKVRAVLPKADVMYFDGLALRNALQYDDHAMAELLYEGSDLTTVLDLLRKDPKTKEFQLHRLIELEQAQRQNTLLKEAVNGVCTQQYKTRKM